MKCNLTRNEPTPRIVPDGRRPGTVSRGATAAHRTFLVGSSSAASHSPAAPNHSPTQPGLPPPLPQPPGSSRVTPLAQPGLPQPLPQPHSASVRHDGPVSTTPEPVTDPLDIVALDTERHVAAAGWDQPPRLFALVPTRELLASQPDLGASLSPADHAEGALSAVEQDDLPPASGVEELLGSIVWPDTVTGAAVAIERIVVPTEAERDLPEDPDAALAQLAAHPDREDVRLLVAVTRDGRATCLLRQRRHDRDDRVARGGEIAPGLIAALRGTLAE